MSRCYLIVDLSIPVSAIFNLTKESASAAATGTLSIVELFLRINCIRNSLPWFGHGGNIIIMWFACRVHHEVGVRKLLFGRPSD